MTCSTEETREKWLYGFLTILWKNINHFLLKTNICTDFNALLIVPRTRYFQHSCYNFEWLSPEHHKVSHCNFIIISVLFWVLFAVRNVRLVSSKEQDLQHCITCVNRTPASSYGQICSWLKNTIAVATVSPNSTVLYSSWR